MILAGGLVNPAPYFALEALSLPGGVQAEIQFVPAVSVSVGLVVGQLPYEKHSEPSDGSIFNGKIQVWRRNLQGIERFSVITKAQGQERGVVGQIEIDLDWSIFDTVVGHIQGQFLDDQV